MGRPSTHRAIGFGITFTIISLLRDHTIEHRLTANTNHRRDMTLNKNQTVCGTKGEIVQPGFNVQRTVKTPNPDTKRRTRIQTQKRYMRPQP